MKFHDIKHKQTSVLENYSQAASSIWGRLHEFIGYKFSHRQGTQFLVSTS